MNLVEEFVNFDEKYVPSTFESISDIIRSHYEVKDFDDYYHLSSSAYLHIFSHIYVSILSQSVFLTQDF